MELILMHECTSSTSLRESVMLLMNVVKVVMTEKLFLQVFYIL